MAGDRVIILIPARLASNRLPAKPLADIAGRPMIAHVLERAREADVGEVVVATDSEAVCVAAEKAGGRAVMTSAEHASGSDRIFEALNQIDPERRVATVVNLQGDLPTLDPADIRAALGALSDAKVDIATIAAEIGDPAERTNPNVVKVIGSPLGGRRLRALYFPRATALERFVKLPPSTLEKREKLEQLRALEAGMRIDVAIVDSAPLGVDTPEDLEKARVLLSR